MTINRIFACYNIDSIARCMQRELLLYHGQHLFSMRILKLFRVVKVHGLPGLRIGWIITKDEKLFGRIAELR